jgi:hypothetical protein
MTTNPPYQRLLPQAKQVLKLSLGIWVVTGLSGGLLCPGSGVNVGGFAPAALAQDLPGGNFFSAPPQLVDSSSTFSGVSVPTPSYYFTIAIPADAGQGLAQVVFQRQDSPDPIEFYPDRTGAFIGDQQNQGQAVPLKTTVWDNNTGLLTVNFAEPVAPGQTVTIRLIPYQNPDVEGTYQFRLLAFPPGDQARSMDLGVARLQFYRGIF